MHTQATATAAATSKSSVWEAELIDKLAWWWIICPILALAVAYGVCRQIKLRKKYRNIKQICWNLQAVITHEIRTPLCAIQKLLDQAMSLAPAPIDLRELISTAQSASHSVVELLDDMLTQSKLEIEKLTLNPQPTNLPDLVQELTDTYGNIARQKNLEFNVRSNCAVTDIQIDLLRLRQILSNLLSNATKFTPHGHITLQVDCKPMMRAGWAQLEITVTDTGIGMADITATTPFDTAGEPARQRYGGNGLGLYLCQQLTQLMKGTLKIKSQAGQGTQIYLQFECEQATATLAPDSTPPFKGMYALVADDDPANQLLLMRHLEQQGLNVMSCNDGEQALRQWAQGSYDILFCDLHMPKLSGSELITRIRSLERQQGKKRTLIVVVSATSCSESITQDVDYRLSKPVSPGELCQALRHCQPSSAQSSQHKPPLVRLEVLHQLSQGDHLFEVNFIRSVLKNNREDLENLLAAYPRRDLQKMTETLHRLIGVMRLLGSDTITAQCLGFEQALREQHTHSIEQLLPIVLQGIQAMNEELQRQLER